MSWIEDWAINASESCLNSSRNSVLSSSLKEDTIEEMQDESVIVIKSQHDSESQDITSDVSLEFVDKSSSFSSHWVNDWAVAPSQDDSVLENSPGTVHVIDAHRDCWANCYANRWGEITLDVSCDSTTTTTSCESATKSKCSCLSKSGSTVDFVSSIDTKSNTASNDTINIDEDESEMMEEEEVQVLGNIDALPPTFRLFTAGCNMTSTGIFK